MPEVSPLPFTIPEGRGVAVFVSDGTCWSSFMTEIETPDLWDKVLRKLCYGITKGQMPWPTRDEIEALVATDGPGAASILISDRVRAFDAHLAVLMNDVRPLYEAALKEITPVA